MTHREAPRVRDLRHSTFVGVTVAFLVFLYLFSPFTQVFLGWFVDFEGSISHRVHEVTFGALFAIIFVGVAAQLRSKRRNFAGLVQAATAALILSIVIAVSTGWEPFTLLYLVPLGTIAWLHPDRREFLKFRLQPHRGLVILMVLVSFSLISAFIKELDKAVNEVRQHQSHWGAMAAFALTLLVVGYLAAFRVHGWPLLAQTTAASVIVYAVVSQRFQFDASARPGATGALAIIWALAFLFTARRARPVPAVRRDQSPLALEPAPGPTTEITGWGRFVPLVRRAVGIAGIFLLGVLGTGLAREATPPPVPHTIGSISANSCLMCHATGNQDAPIIDWRTHNSYEETRFVRPFCGECHSLPPITAALIDRFETIDHLPDLSSVLAALGGLEIAHLSDGDAEALPALVKTLDERRRAP